MKINSYLIVAEHNIIYQSIKRSNVVVIEIKNHPGSINVSITSTKLLLSYDQWKMFEKFLDIKSSYSNILY